MKPKPYTLLLNPLFLTGLVLLLFNDLDWKYRFHNNITGKLSDVAGLLVFALFFMALMPGRRLLVGLAIALIFVWWKSPFSEPLITLLNTTFYFPVHRVVDYTDYIALPILLLAWRLQPVFWPGRLLRNFAIAGAGGLSLFSFCATSVIRRAADDNRVSLDEYVRTRKSEKEIIQALKDNKMNPYIDTIYERVWDRNYYLKITAAGLSARMVPLDSLYNGLYSRVNYGTSYTIPEIYLNGDTIHNLKLVISHYSRRKEEVRLHSFEMPGHNSGYHPYTLWWKYHKPIRKQFKAILKKRN